jgi:hypothetical protein
MTSQLREMEDAVRKDSLRLVIFVPIGLYVALMLALAAFVVHPPLLGWIGFAVAAAVALLAGALAVAFFSRMRTNTDRLHPRTEPVYRLLVVTNSDVEPAELRSAVRLRALGRRVDVRVIAPVIATTLHFATADEADESAAAERRLEATLAALAVAGIAARGSVGTDDPLQATADVLAGFHAHEILLVSPLRSRRSWLDRDFERRARDLFGVPVSTVFGTRSDGARPHRPALAETGTRSA